MAKHAGGRPTLYRPEMCEEAIGWMKKGHSIIEVAYLLNIGRSTLYEWIEKFPEFADAIKKGVDFSEGKWMIDGGLNSLRDKDFNATLWYMNMKNRFGWKDKQYTTVDATVRQEDAIKDLG